MKFTLKFLTVLVLAIGFYSCSSDDDEVPVPEAEGFWRLTSLTIETAFDLNGDGTASRDLVQEVECYDNDYIEFFSTGVVDIRNAFAFIFADVNLTSFEYDYDCQTGFDLQADWTQNGSQVNVTSNFIQLEGNLSGNTMTVFIPDSFEIELYDGTTFMDVEEDITLVYTKQ